MTYILSNDGRDENVSGAFRRYYDYLSMEKARFPRSAYDLATSNWYFNFQDHRCPHDAWLESLLLTEPYSGERNEIRQLSIEVRLLGAYHDGHIMLRYPRVFRYRLDIQQCEGGHKDWRYDEFRLSEHGHLIHEIEWCGFCDSGTWIIEASDVEFSWHPKITD